MKKTLAALVTGAGLTLAALTPAAAADLTLDPSYTPSPERPTCTICGQAWGLGFDVFAVTPRQKIFLDNGGPTGFTPGSAQSVLGALGINRFDGALNAAALGSRTKNFFSTIGDVPVAFDKAFEAYGESHPSVTASQLNSAKKEIKVWGNFYKGALAFGATEDQARGFASLRPLFLDRVENVGVDRALHELFAALDIYLAGGTPSNGVLAARSSEGSVDNLDKGSSGSADGSASGSANGSSAGPLGSSKGFHPADQLGGLAGGSSGFQSARAIGS